MSSSFSKNTIRHHLASLARGSILDAATLEIFSQSYCWRSFGCGLELRKLMLLFSKALTLQTLERWTDKCIHAALYGSTTVSETLGLGITENVSMIRSGYSSCKIAHTHTHTHSLRRNTRQQKSTNTSHILLYSYILYYARLYRTVLYYAALTLILLYCVMFYYLILSFRLAHSFGHALSPHALLTPATCPCRLQCLPPTPTLPTIP